jgi:hypothetical protein
MLGDDSFFPRQHYSVATVMVSATAALNVRIASLHHVDREQRLHKAKAIGRIAYRIARAASLVGVRDIEGEEKNLREFRGGLLFIDLHEPSRLAVDAEFSWLRISYNGKKVFEIRWDGPSSLNILLFEETVEWIGSLARAKDATDAARASSGR